MIPGALEKEKERGIFEFWLKDSKEKKTFSHCISAALRKVAKCTTLAEADAVMATR